MAAPKNRVVRKRALVRASARLRALVGPQALQNHTALPGASAAHQGRCAARPLGRSRSQQPAESPARAREAWCSQQRGVNLQLRVQLAPSSIWKRRSPCSSACCPAEALRVVINDHDDVVIAAGDVAACAAGAELDLVVHDVAARQAMDKVTDLDVELGALHDRLPGGRRCGAELVPPSGHGHVGVITPGVMAALASACSYPG
eukprot:COSAG06_NODE_468_length_15337_cov_84.949075_12_plen_203_part_00